MVKTIIICDKCGSEDVQTLRTEKKNVDVATVLDCDSLRSCAVEKNYDKVMECKCNKCGHIFEENLGTRTYHLSPWEIFK